MGYLCLFFLLLRYCFIIYFSYIDRVWGSWLVFKNPCLDEFLCWNCRKITFYLCSSGGHLLITRLMVRSLTAPVFMPNILGQDASPQLNERVRMLARKHLHRKSIGCSGRVEKLYKNQSIYLLSFLFSQSQLWWPNFRALSFGGKLWKKHAMWWLPWWTRVSWLGVCLAADTVLSFATPPCCMLRCLSVTPTTGGKTSTMKFVRRTGLLLHRWESTLSWVLRLFVFK